MGDIPPPMHGMATINKRLLDFSRARGSVCFINTAPSVLASFFNGKYWGLIKIAFFFPVTGRLLWALLRCRDRVFYRSLNGGAGQVFDLCWVLLARIAGVRIYLHHHASSYLLMPTGLFKLLVKVAGRGAHHVVLGEVMYQALVINCRVPAGQVRIVSNAAFFSCDTTKSPSVNDCLHIGYLANLSISKGVDVFLQVVSMLYHGGASFKATIAGPCADAELQRKIQHALTVIPALRWVGPVYGDSKKDFLESLDVFVYPSRNEAEPLVLYEAAQQGALLVGSQAGCMKDMIAHLEGASLPLQESDKWAAWAVGVLDSADVSPSAKTARKECLQTVIFESKYALSNLLKDFFHAPTR